jgi:protoporphyrinogen/coproporphyrinogen III oxidase
MTQPDVVVVGAGITGLTCAYRLRKLGMEPLVLESSGRVGGVIQTQNINGHLVEWGPSSLLPTAHTYGILEELGLIPDLVHADPKAPRYIVIGGRLRQIPLGPLSVKGIFRGLTEPLVRTKSSGDESVASFFRRRFGTEVQERIVAPFVTGIFAGDTEKLSVGAVFPRILEIEQEFGSVILGMLRGKPKSGNGTGGSAKPHKSVISSFSKGLETLPARIAEGLNINTRCSGIRIGTDIRAKATVLAVPAYQAAEILNELHPELADTLRAIEYAPIVVAATSLKVSSLSAPLRGFGFLAPRSEGLTILGTVFNSLLFLDRAPDDRILLTSFLGGASRPEIFDWPEERIWNTVCGELKRILKTSLQPEPVGLHRHRRAIPQYNIGQKQRVEAIASELKRVPGLFISGNFLHGVSLPACMEHGDNTAKAVAEFLGKSA